MEGESRMTEHTAVITRKGQVTVPAEIRRELGLSRGDRLTFVSEHGAVRIEKRGSVVERTAGILKKYALGLPAEAEREAFEQAVADDVVERMNR